MAKLTLKYEAAVLREIPVRKSQLTIGRAPDNDIVIDNLAVSGHHAQLLVEEGRFLIEDLNSMNGTFLNNQRILRSPLKNGDEIVIGKHSLVFQEEGQGSPIFAGPGWYEKGQKAPQSAEATVVLDTKKRREFLAKATAIATEGASAEAAERLGCLVTLAGKTSQKEYILSGKFWMIGKDPGASVQIKGWFLPKVAAIINKRGRTYDIAPSEKAGVTRLNGHVLVAPQELKEGDLIEIKKVKFQFYYRE
ncbi:MAG TPA: FHA domain-containing protein [Terriglobia bacterium]|nr:FHA domain-containing protein [Terriglobia bacterium]